MVGICCCNSNDLTVVSIEMVGVNLGSICINHFILLGPLDYLLREPPLSKQQLLSEEHARFFFLQLVYALHHCHEQRIAHRDVKFASIVLDGKKTPILKVITKPPGFVAPSPVV